MIRAVALSCVLLVSAVARAWAQSPAPAPIVFFDIAAPAEAAGVLRRPLRPYQSHAGRAAAAAIHARNPIGIGPWYNATGVMIAKDVDDLGQPSLAPSLPLRNPCPRVFGGTTFFL